jgi:hypothetical protein
MSPSRLAGLVVLFAVISGCHHRPRQPKTAFNTLPVNGPGLAPAPPPPPVDDRSAGQVVIDILTQQGYTCAAEETRWICNSPAEAGWPFTVSYVPEETKTTIWIDSYVFRAFGKKCAQYTNHMADLAVPDNAFAVTCDDTTQQFRMNQSLLYGADLDVPAWAQNHLANRKKARGLLASAHAIRIEK